MLLFLLLIYHIVFILVTDNFKLSVILSWCQSKTKFYCCTIECTFLRISVIHGETGSATGQSSKSIF